MNNTIIGFDIAKTNFHAVIINERGKELKRKALKRKNVLEYFANLEQSLVALEACSGSSYWGRELVKLGHSVKIIPAEKVKPYLSKQKNDFNDAAAIAEAASRDSVKWITPGREEQQDIQNILRVRERHVKNRTALSNQIRGLLAEYGIVFNKGSHNLLKELPLLLECNKNTERDFWRLIFQDLYNELSELSSKVRKYDKLIVTISNKHPECKRLQTLPGVGPITAVAIIAAVNNINDFRNGRQFSAWLGIVPKQNSSGGKTKLLGITKRGDKYIRKLLVHGGRTMVQYADKEKTPWLYHLKKRRGYNKASVAQANKTARRIYAILKYGEEYNPHK